MGACPMESSLIILKLKVFDRSHVYNMNNFVSKLKTTDFVQCKDWITVEQKLKRIHGDGLSQLHIISGIYFNI